MNADHRSSNQLQ